MNKENRAWIKRIARRHVDGSNSIHRQDGLRWCVCGHPLCWHKGECGSQVADGIGGLQPCDCPTFVSDVK
jgi:hypothetical protein